MVDNPNGDYGICRATNSDRDKDEQCMCSMSGGKKFSPFNTTSLLNR